MNHNGPMASKCEESRAHEIFLNSFENQLHRFEAILDDLNYKVQPVSIDKNSCTAKENKELKEQEAYSPFIHQLYRQSEKLDQILSRLIYIKESIQI